MTNFNIKNMTKKEIPKFDPSIFHDDKITYTINKIIDVYGGMEILKMDSNRGKVK